MHDRGVVERNYFFPFSRDNAPFSIGILGYVAVGRRIGEILVFRAKDYFSAFVDNAKFVTVGIDCFAVVHAVAITAFHFRIGKIGRFFAFFVKKHHLVAFHHRTVTLVVKRPCEFIFFGGKRFDCFAFFVDEHDAVAFLHKCQSFLENCHSIVLRRNGFFAFFIQIAPFPIFAKSGKPLGIIDRLRDLVRQFFHFFEILVDDDNALSRFHGKRHIAIKQPQL